MLNGQKMEKHERHDQHLLATAAFNRHMQNMGAQEENDLGPISGISDAVPRLDRWVHVATVLSMRASWADFEKVVRYSEVGSIFATGVDGSRLSVVKMIHCLAQPWRSLDFAYMRDAASSSLGLDARDGILLVYARILSGDISVAPKDVKQPQWKRGIYECILGEVRLEDADFSAIAVRDAIELVIRRACTRCFGPRSEIEEVEGACESRRAGKPKGKTEDVEIVSVGAC